MSYTTGLMVGDANQANLRKIRQPLRQLNHSSNNAASLSGSVNETFSSSLLGVFSVNARNKVKALELDQEENFATEPGYPDDEETARIFLKKIARILNQLD